MDRGFVTVCSGMDLVFSGVELLLSVADVLDGLLTVAFGVCIDDAATEIVFGGGWARKAERKLLRNGR